MKNDAVAYAPASFLIFILASSLLEYKIKVMEQDFKQQLEELKSMARQLSGRL